VIGIDNSSFSIANTVIASHRSDSCKSANSSHGDSQLSPRIARYVALAISDNTRKAYNADLRVFVAGGGKVPALPHDIAEYLVDNADKVAPAVLDRRLIAIGRVHAMLGFPNPCSDALVRSTMRGIWRVHGRPPRQVLPLLAGNLRAMLPHMTGTRGMRDRALILIGFAGAFRRSELVALQYEDLTFVPDGMTLMIRRSKTDQKGVGRRIAIPFARSKACPVNALRDWLTCADIKGGPLFRGVNKAGRVAVASLTPQSVAAIVKAYAVKAGLDATSYSGHSLRAGLITSAARAGVGTWKIRQMSGHRSDAMLTRYIRDGESFDGNAAGAVL
jgi:integrase